jgi:hypothetical protein
MDNSVTRTEQTAVGSDLTRAAGTSSASPSLVDTGLHVALEPTVKAPGPSATYRGSPHPASPR